MGIKGPVLEPAFLLGTFTNKISDIRVFIKKGGIMKYALVCIFAALSIYQPLFAKTKVAASVELEYGQSWAKGLMNHKLTDGQTYRLYLFGGAKMPKIKFLRAVGLGLDFTYSTFKDKFKSQGFKYERYTWDWFHVPFSISILKFRTGISWVVTSVRDNSLGIKEKSIRPGFVGSAGIRIPFWRVAFLVDVRGEYVWEDKESTIDGREVLITGSFLSALAGIGYYF
jgi:hypothetical protein